MSEIEFKECKDWDEESIREYNALILAYESNLDELDKATDIVERLKLEKEIELMETRITYAGDDPNTLPKSLLKEMPKISEIDDDSVVSKYRKSTKNRATAIRALCIICQGSSLVGVRECPSVNCPLWLFRLGKDPLRGKVAFTSDDFVEEEGGVTDTEEEEDARDME